MEWEPVLGIPKPSSGIAGLCGIWMGDMDSIKKRGYFYIDAVLLVVKIRFHVTNFLCLGVINFLYF